MRGLLSIKSLRQLELLEYLYDKDWVTIDTISKNLGYNEKSIRTEIQFLNNNSKKLSLETSLKFGVRLMIPDSYSRTLIYSYILFDSLEFFLLENIFFIETFSTEKLAESLFISPSTLRRLIKSINEKLIPYNFSISSNPYKLIGSESAIRNFIIHLIFEKYSDAQYPFPKTQLLVLEKIFHFSQKILTVSLNYPDIDKLKIWTMVTIIRIKNGNTTDVTNMNSNDHFDTILKNKLLTTSFKTIFKLTLDANLLKQLFLLFSNESYAQNFSQLQTIKNSNSANSDLYAKCEQLLTTISDDLNIEIPNYNHVLLHFFNEINLYYGDNYVLFDKTADFIKNSNAQIHIFYNYFLKNYQTIFGKNNSTQSQLYNLCYCLIIHWENIMTHLETKVEPVIIGLFFNSDIEHMHFLCDYIQNLFHGQCSISIINQKSIVDLKKVSSDYDIILTNIDGIKIANATIYCCSLLPSINDLTAIGKLIKSKRM